MMSDQFESSNSSVMAISINPKNTEVAFAVCNTNRRLFEYTLFVDNELLAILESAIIQTFTKEVLYAPTGVGYLDEKVKNLFIRCNLTYTEQKKSRLHHLIHRELQER